MLGLAETFGETIGGLGKFTADMLFIKPISGQMDRLKDAITPTSTKSDLQNYARLQNTKHLLPGNLLNSVAETESSWNPMADSGKAKGLFQFTPETGKGYGLEGAAIWDPYKQTNAAARYFGDLNKQYGGDIAKMLSQYNGGNKAVSDDGSLNLKQETVNYLLKLLPRINGALEQHPEIMGQLYDAKSALANRGQDARVSIQIDQKPGSNIDAQVNGISLVRR
jgi:hypothetical protein